MNEPLIRPETLPRIAGHRIDGQPVEVPGYPRRFTKRICHLGIGRFHRAHQAAVLDRLLQQGEADSWGLCAIGLRAADRSTLDALRAQDGLYTLTETDGQTRRVRVIGSIMQLVDATENVHAAIAVMADAATRIISLTITEAGYCLDARGRLDHQHADIKHDVVAGASPRSVPGLITSALAARRAIGGRGVTLMSCDNLIDNGERLRAAVLDFAESTDPSLAKWIKGHCRFPCSMVDRITPAANADRETALCSELGLHDAAPVLSENWLQWVLEDDFADGRPPFERAGVVLSSQVSLFERIKVGLLNGGHSAIAHVGLLRGHTGVHQAMADPLIANWLALYLCDVAEVLERPPGLDLEDYCLSLARRFGNAALEDTLLRLAQDSSNKLIQTLRPIVLLRVEHGQSCQTPSLAIAMWITYLANLDSDRDAASKYEDRDKHILIRAAVGAFACGDTGTFLDAYFPLPSIAAALFVAEVNSHLVGIHRLGLEPYLVRTVSQRHP